MSFCFSVVSFAQESKVFVNNITSYFYIDYSQITNNTVGRFDIRYLGMGFVDNNTSTSEFNYFGTSPRIQAGGRFTLIYVNKVPNENAKAALTVRGLGGNDYTYTVSIRSQPQTVADLFRYVRIHDNNIVHSRLSSTITDTNGQNTQATISGLERYIHMIENDFYELRGITIFAKQNAQFTLASFTVTIFGETSLISITNNFLNLSNYRSNREATYVFDYWKQPSIGITGAQVDIYEGAKTTNITTGLTVEAEDPDDNTRSMSITVLNDNRFSVNASNAIILKAYHGIPIDEESITLTIRAFNERNDFNTTSLTINIASATITPISIAILGSQTVNINEGVHIGRGNSAFQKTGISLRYSLDGNETNLRDTSIHVFFSNDAFSADERLSDNSIVTQLGNYTVTIDYESLTDGKLRVTAFARLNNQAKWTSKEFTVTIENVDEPPVILASYDPQFPFLEGSHNYLPSFTGHEFSVSDPEDDAFNVQVFTPSKLTYFEENNRYSIFPKLGSAFDHEDPDDRLHTVIVIATAKDKSTRREITISVGDRDDTAPILAIGATSLTINEGNYLSNFNTSIRIQIFDPDPSDENIFSVDDSRFFIDRNQYLNITTSAYIDYESDSDKKIPLQIGLQSGLFRVNFDVTLSINDVNDAPSISVLSTTQVANLYEGNYTVNTNTGFSYSISDEDNDALTISIVPDLRFTINSNGSVIIKSGTSFDYEVLADRFITLTISAMDASLTTATSLTISIIDFTHDISLLGSLVAITETIFAEDFDTGYTVSINNPSNTSISLNISDNFFQLGEEKQLEIKANTNLDYETASHRVRNVSINFTVNSHEIGVIATVSIINFFDSPTLHYRNMVTVIDEETNHTAFRSWDVIINDPESSTRPQNALTLNFEHDIFKLSLNSGLYFFGMKSEPITQFDYENPAHRLFKLTITITDRTNNMTFTDDFTITIRNIDDNAQEISVSKPSVQLFTLAEVQRTTAVIETGITFTVSDRDGDLTPLTIELDDTRFQLITVNDKYGLQIKQGVNFDYETALDDVVDFVVSSGNYRNVRKQVTITIQNVDDNPINRFQLAGGDSTDNTKDEGVFNVSTKLQVSFEITDRDGWDNGLNTISISDNRFTVVWGDPLNVNNYRRGTVWLKPGNRFDYENPLQRDTTVFIRAWDTYGTVTQSFNFVVRDLQDSTPEISRSGTQNSINEGTISAITDTGYSYTFTDDDTDLANLIKTFSDSRFTLGSNNELQIKASVTIDYEDPIDRNLSLTLTADDGINATTNVVALSFGNINDNKPIITTLGSQTIINEGTIAINTDTGVTVSISDPDGNLNALNIGLSNDKFFLTTNGKLMITAGTQFDYEVSTQRSQIITISVSDTVNTVNETITIRITDVNDVAPEITRSGNQVTINEATFNSATNTGYTYTFTDADTNIDNLVNYFSDNRFILGSNNELQINANTNLDYENPEHQFITVALNIFDGVHIATNTVTISISNINDNNPTISISGPQKRINEGKFDTATDTGITVSIYDADESLHTLSIGVSNNKFILVTSSWDLQISVGATLDYEDSITELITVSVSDGSNNAEAAVTITVTDRNDTAPRITRSGSQVSINEGTISTPTNTGYSYNFTDVDSDDATLIKTFSDNRFELNGSNNNLRIKANSVFDYETATDRNLIMTLTVSDGTNETTNEISLTLGNINDNKPVIVTSGTQVSIYEGNYPNKIDTGIKIDISDRDGSLNNLNIQLSNNKFNLDTDGDLEVIANAGLDYEDSATQTVTITVSDSTNTVNETITVSVTDVNDNAPVLSRSGTQVSINEGTLGEVTDTGYSYSATDDDTTANTNFTYSISDTTNFQIESSGTNRKLQMKAVAIDFETKSTYTVTVTVKDGTSSSANSDTNTVVITITNLNDNAPVISTVGSQTVINEGDHSNNTDTGITINITDADGTLNELSTVISDDKFIIAANGDLQIKANTSFDYETKTAYTITISTSDTNTTTRLIVTISITDQDDQAPVITRSGSQSSINEGTISSATPIGYTYIFNDVDSDNTSLSKTLSDNRFEIQGNNNALRIKANSVFDYETTTDRNLIVTLVVSDGNNSTNNEISLTLGNINDNAPVIATSGSQTVINEGSYRNNTDTGITVNISDADGDLNNLIIGISDTKFILAANGDLQIKAGTTFDYEDKTAHTITISANDSNTTTRFVITINIADIDDNAPVITRSGSQSSINEGTISTATDIGYTYTFNDVDSNNDSLTKSVSDNRFELHGNNNALRIKTNSVFDYETATDRNLIVTLTVSDGTNSASNEISLTLGNINDNAPVIATVGSQTVINEGTYSNNTDTGITVNIADPDGTLNSLSIGISNTNFILASNGDLQIKASTSFDYEITAQRTHTITISVSDTSTTTTFVITISITDTDDNAPAINRSGSQNSINEGTISLVTNTGYTYTFTDADTDDDNLTKTFSDNRFQLGSNNELQIKANVTFDYEATTDRNLIVTITVSDGSNETTNAVNINIGNINDNAPVIATTGSQIVINEGTYSNNTDTGVTVDISDRDGDLNNLIIGISNAKFILAANGDLQIKAGNVFDYEITTDRTQLITISANDSNVSTTRVVTISISDVSDSVPEITRSGTQRSISEGTISTATDTGYSYAITDADTANDNLTKTLSDNRFELNGSNNNLRIKVNSVFDYESTTDRNLVVTLTVSDGSNETTNAVNIVIGNINDNSPVIATTGSQTVINEGTYNNNTDTGITINITDTDGTLNSLTKELSNSKFILAANGDLQIKANSSFDYESTTDRRHEITITVSDGTNTSTRVVTINITDTNDTEPVLTKSGSQVSINEGTLGAITDTGYSYSATDADTSANTSFTYSVSDTTNFQIESSGTNRKLQMKAIAIDFETKSTYTVTVTVSDGSNTDSDTVVITITNLNDNDPAIAKSGTQVSIGESTYSSDTDTGIIVTISDADETLNNLSLTDTHADFKLVSTNITNQFKLQIIANKSFDHESDDEEIVTVTVSDSARNAEVEITITISDDNEAPSISSNHSTRSLGEATFNSDTDTGIVVNVTDDDENETKSYTVSDSTNFQVASDGKLQIKTSVSFDYEETEDRSHTVTITVTDKGNNTDTVVVTINITNVNERPVVANAIADQNATIGETFSFTFDANVFSDVDANTTFSYAVTKPSWLGFDSNSRTFTASAAQVPSSATVITITVTASDGSLSVSDIFEITVSANQAPEIAVNGSQNLVINENATRNAATDTGYSFTITDDDGTIASKVLSHDGFILSSDKLQVKAAASFDREADHPVVITLTVTDNNGASTTATVTISINNVDEAPSVSTSGTQNLIEEGTFNNNTDTGISVTGSDPDNDTITYSVNDSTRFQVASGKLQIKSGTTFNYATTAHRSHTLTITATAGSKTGTTIVTINIADANNNAPVLTRAGSQVTINEGTLSSVTDTGYTYSATDADTNTSFTYTVSDTTNFQIQASGNNRKLQLKAITTDYETKSTYTITVTVSDGSNTDTDAVVINITNLNDNDPTIAKTGTQVAITEGSFANVTDTGINISVADKDGNLHSSLNLTETHTKFQLTTTATTNIHKLQIAANQSFDYEVSDEALVTITVSDGTKTSNITITISITDANDTNPVLIKSGSQVTINEGTLSAVTDTGYSFSATDADTTANTNFTYSISDTTNFQIESSGTNRKLQMKAITLDHETKSTYTVVVTISDGSNIDTESIVITITNLNDNDPVISQSGTQVVIGESVFGSDTDTGILVAISDHDGSLNNFNITYSHSKFKLVTTSVSNQYKLQIVANNSFDYETSTTEEININVSDGANNATRVITITITDQNDTAPVLSRTGSQVNINEGTISAVTDTGYSYSATDADTNPSFSYSVSDTTNFQIEASGTNRKLQIKAVVADYETKPTYTVTVTVSDGSNTDTDAVVITITNINDNAPVIATTGSQARILEGTYNNNTDTGITINITDPDGSLNALSTVVSNNNFILAANGDLQIKASTSFDYEVEAQRTHTITISANDTNATTTRTITISISDQDDTAPQISRSGSQVVINEGTISAATDTGYTYTFSDSETDEANLTKSLSDNRFILSNNKLQIKANSVFDYENSNDRNLIITITVSDGSNNVTNMVAIVIGNLNDNPPLVSSSGTQNSINEGAYTNNTDTGITINISDADGTLNRLQINLSDSKFAIASNGDLQIKAGTSFDYETARAHTITIRVNDTNVTTTLVVTVSINNVSDNAPVITRSGSQGVINEGSTASATNTGYSYSFRDADTNVANLIKTLSDNRFTLGSNNELQIKASVTLDFENTSQQSLVVSLTVSDGSNIATNVVTITINNLNDNSPVISKSGSQVSILEGTININTDTGITINISDADGTLNSLNINLSNDKFILAANGDLQVKYGSSFDYEAASERTQLITIRVNDGNFVVSEEVTINISDVDENAPVEIVRNGSQVRLNEGLFSRDTATGYSYQVNNNATLTLANLAVNNNNFFINDEGNLLIKTGLSIDYENELMRMSEIIVSTRDTLNRVYSNTVIIQYTNVYEQPILRSPIPRQFAFAGEDFALTVNGSGFVVDLNDNANISCVLYEAPTWMTLRNEIFHGMVPVDEETQTVTVKFIVSHTTQTVSSSVTVAFDLAVYSRNVKDDNFVEQAIISRLGKSINDNSLIDATERKERRANNNDNVSVNFNQLVDIINQHRSAINAGEASATDLLAGNTWEFNNNDNLNLWLSFHHDLMRDEDLADINFDGSVSASRIGIDKQLGNSLFGLAYSHHIGKFTYDQVGDQRGEYELDYDLIQPYFASEITDIEYWLSFGLGIGALDVTKLSQQNRKLTSDLDIYLGGFGININSFELPGSTTSRNNIDFFTDLSMSRVEIDRTNSIADQINSRNYNLKSGFLYKHDRLLDNQGSTTTKLGIAARGRVEDEKPINWGYELFSSINLLTSGIFDFRGKFKYVVIDKYSQLGVAGLINYQNRDSALGAFINIEPNYGYDDNSIRDLANDVSFDSMLNKDPFLRLDSEVGYGFGFINGIITPYGEYQLIEDYTKYGLGVRYQHADKFTWQLKVNNPSKQDEETEFGIEYKIIN